MASSTDFELFSSSFCAFSQRIEIALLEGRLPYAHHSFPGGASKLPDWVLKLSPQGILPFLKYKNIIHIGSDAIEVFLAGHTKLVPNKKKQYNNLIMHCKTTLEPIVSQLIDESNERRIGHIANIFYAEMEMFENAIKGPFVLGSSFSWVDIYYWTILQQVPLFEHLHGITLPSTYININSWLDRLSKRASFVKAAHDKHFINWFDNLRGRGNIRPATSLLEFTEIINNAIRRGIEELLDLCKSLNFLKREEAKTFFSKFADFNAVLREHSASKVNLVIKECTKRGITGLDSLVEAFDKQKQVLNILKTILDKISLHTSLSSAKPHVEGHEAKSTLIEWKIMKLNEKSSLPLLQEQLVTTMERFNESLCEDLKSEENTLTRDSLSKCFTKRELFNLNRKIALYPSGDVLSVYTPWVVSKLMDPTQIRTFVLYYRFVMPFCFPQDIVACLKLGLSSALWTDVRRHIDNIKIAEEKFNNPNSDRTSLPPVPPRKHTQQPTANFPSTNKVQSVLIAKNQIFDDEMIAANPLLVIRFINDILKSKLCSIRSICIRSISLVNLNTLQDSLDILFSFFSVKHNQEESVFYPFLIKKSSNMRPLISSYLYDSKEAMDQMFVVSRKITNMRTSSVSTDDTQELISQIICYISLELHFLHKQQYVYELLLKLASFDEQAAIIRNLLDLSPTSFVDTLIPWALRQLSNDKQISFVIAMNSVLSVDLFSKLLLPIRRVLPVALCNTLLDTKGTRKSL